MRTTSLINVPYQFHTSNALSLVHVPYLFSLAKIIYFRHRPTTSKIICIAHFTPNTLPTIATDGRLLKR